MRRILRFLVALCTLAAAGVAAHSQQLSPEVQDHLDRARADMNRNQYNEAIAEYRRALKLSDSCVECAFQLARAYQQVGAHKDALETGLKALAVAPTDRLRATAHNLIGVETSKLADDGKMKHEDAERQFRTALQLNPDDSVAYYNLGAELLKEFRDPEGIAVLNDYLKRNPEGSNAKAARALIDNPRRARENFAPVDFSLVTRNGDYMTLDEVKGRVVLLDFWASWCKPCEESLPVIRRLSKRYAKDQFVLVSISVDSNEQAWQGFMNKNHMDWEQVLDRDYKLRRMFKVQPIPTYILIDPEGIMRSYVIGADSWSVARLEDEVKKNLKYAQNLEKAIAAKAPVPTAAGDAAPASSPAAAASEPPPVATRIAEAPPSAPSPAAPRPAPARPDPAASPAVPPAAGTAAVEVSSNPDGAEIYLDQNFVGNAPATLQLKPGRHAFRLALGGYRSWTRDFAAQAGSQVRLDATLIKSIPGAVQGRVLWNERPAAGAQLFAHECYPSAQQFGPATTDAEGHFEIPSVPDGRVCMEIRFPNPPAFWYMGMPPVDVPSGQKATAPDSYICKLFTPISPKAEEWVSRSRPVLKWDPQPDAVGYSVQVWRLSPDRRYIGVFRKGDRDPRIQATSVEVDVDMSPGDYYWRVDAINSAGHIIGCNYPIKFTVIGSSSDAGSSAGRPVAASR